MKKILIVFATFLLLYSCSDAPQEQAEHYSEKTISMDTNIETSCPFLTTDGKGNVVMSWGKQTNDSNGVMCYATYNNKENLFENPIEIPSSRGVQLHNENLPKIVFKPDGQIIAVWGVSNPSPKKKYGGLVYYAQSFDEGKTWSSAKPLVSDTASIDQRYFDVVILPNGEVGIIWLDSRTKTDKQGSTLYYAATNGKNGFENEKAIGETICQCCRTDLFVDSKGSVHAAYRDIINDSIRDMVHTVSIDGGETFSPPQRISADNWVINGCPHTGPTMTENEYGLHFAWYTMGSGEGVFYCNSTDNGETFSLRDSVSGKVSAKHPQIATLANGDIIIVWDETIQKEKQYNKWIGLQYRSSDGKVINTSYITPDTEISGYPVVKAIGENSVLVAFSRSVGNKEHVFYRKITIDTNY